tara:strand:+ start:403 stop:585 length:183 start_codon:yes stop_codon:yes gene_type:complete
MTDSEEDANRLFKLMYTITCDKNDAKDCAIICAEEVKRSVDECGRRTSYDDLVINEIKKI